MVENVLRRLSPEGLYYAARALFGEDFSRSLGPLFESYVGTQFSSLPNATVWPEVVFGNNERSVDWFVAVDDWLLLVEAKATRMPMAARAGRRDAVHEAIARTLGKGSDQITRSAELIRARLPAFTHLPSDRRLLGMVVTLEPYYTAMSPFNTARPSASVPLCSVPISEIEFLVAVGQASPLAPTLERVAAGAGLVKELSQLPREPNPLIAEAWGRLPFG